MNISTWSGADGDKELVRTTCRAIGFNEDFFEARLAAMPSLLGLESRRSGVRGPFCVFRQSQLPTPQGKVVAPDIVFLAASGHLVIVEVKLGDNSELGRSVIAQIMEYAGSFVALDDDALLRMFPGGREAGTWLNFVKTCFPDEARIDELAFELRDRIVRGEIRLIIACDSVPPGFRELVAGVVTQSAIGFSLDVVEIVPYVAEGNAEKSVIFVPSTRISTEIIARTAVTITYRQGDTKPSTLIEVSTPDPEQIAASARAVADQGRIWSEEEIFDAVKASGDLTLRRLYDLALKLSRDGTVVTGGTKKTASFGFHFSPQRGRRVCLCSCQFFDEKLWVFRRTIADAFGEETEKQFVLRLKRIEGLVVDESKSQLGYKWSEIADKFDEMAGALEWLLSQAD